MKEFTIILLGDQCVGKSSIAQRLCQNFFIETYEPTIEDLYRKVYEYNTPDGGSTYYMISILDTAGSAEFYDATKYINDKKYNDCNVVYVLVFSLSDKRTFNWLSDIYDTIELNTAEDLSVPIILVGNKADLPKRVSPQKIYKFRTNNDLQYIETSAKLSTGLYQILKTACEIYEEYCTKPKKHKKCIII